MNKIELSFGNRLREKRLEKKLTQEELAKKVGYTSRSTINKLELDKINCSYEKLHSLANVLDTDIDYLLGIPPENWKLIDSINLFIDKNSEDIIQIKIYKDLSFGDRDYKFSVYFNKEYIDDIHLMPLFDEDVIQKIIRKIKNKNNENNVCKQ